MSTPAPPNRLAILRPGALGDAILTLPVLESLRAGSQGAHIVVAGSPAFRLAADCGLASEAVPFDDRRLLGLFAIGGTSKVVAGCGVCLAYGRRPDPLLAASLKRSGVARVIEWPAMPEKGVHAADHLLGAVEAAGLPVATRIPRLPPQPAWREAARAWLAARGLGGGFVAIHPGSGGQRKRWPVARFAEVALRAAQPVVWLLGPAEGDDREARAIGEQAGTVADDLPLSTLAGLLACCRAYLGNDSGVSHLAAAVGAPTVALFGPTDPAVWAPRGPHVAVLDGKGDLDGIAVDQVIAALDEARALTRPW